MAWIESHQELERHPKILLLKTKMRWSLNETIGFLHRFWWTVLEYAPKGALSTLPPMLMAEMLKMDSEVIDRVYLEMEDVGLLDREDEVLYVHDWYDFAGKLLDRRARNTESKRKARKKKNDVTVTSRGHHKDVTQMSESTVPYRTVPKEKVKKENPPNSVDAFEQQFQDSYQQVLDVWKSLRQAEGLKFFADQKTQAGARKLSESLDNGELSLDEIETAMKNLLASEENRTRYTLDGLANNISVWLSKQQADKKPKIEVTDLSRLYSDS